MPQIPEQLLNSLSRLPGFEREAFVEAHREENRLSSLRLNPFKKTDLDFETGEKVRWHPEAYYLPARPSFTHDPLFHAGCYYVQEAGSMFLDLAIRQTLNLEAPLRLLDACAAPGGKSTLVNALLKPGDLLVSNEIRRSRAGVLAENLGRWGTGNTVVTNNETSRFSDLEGFFDAVVADAPCSGSGLFRKQPEAIDEWSAEAVEMCSRRQKDILADLHPCLKPGGYLYYSTCSYSVAENEDIVTWLQAELGYELVRLETGEEMGVVAGTGYRFYPHLTGSEGFYLAVLRKNGGNRWMGVGKGTALVHPTLAETDLLKRFVQAEGGVIFKKNGQFHLLNEAGAAFLRDFDKQFYFRKAGVVIGEIKGKDLVPNQELAWSLQVGEEVERLDLAREDALKYLKKENFSLPALPAGLRLVTYKNYGIGWAKVMATRINNYLPQEVRILK